MKNIFLILCISLVSLASATPIVSDVLVRQMWPWEKKIRVTCTIGGVTVGHEARLRITAYRGETFLGEIPDAALSGDAWALFGGAGRKTVWVDPSKTDLLPSEGAVDDLRIVVQAEDVGTVLYKVVDLTKEAGEAGQQVCVSEKDLNAGLYGACETNPISGIASIVWTTPAAEYESYAGSKLVLRRVASGSFMMGENLSSSVTLSEYWIGIFPITFQQLANVTGASAGSMPYKSSGECNYDLCRGSVDTGCVWPESGHAVASESLIAQFRAKTGLNGLDLPTEAQWEWVCCAGTTTTYYNNTDDGSTLTELAWYSENSGNMLHRPGRKLPNAWGFYDMIGNIWEFVRDWYSGTAVGLDSGWEPAGMLSAGRVFRLVRGGAYTSGADNCSNYSRTGDDKTAPAPSVRGSIYGFRVVQVGW